MSAESKAAPHLDTTLVKGIQVLEALIRSESPSGVSALSTSLGIGKSNVHRMLATLGELGFVHQEPDTKRYFATMRSWELGSFVVERDIVRRNARGVLLDLLNRTGETTFLATLVGADVLYLDKLDGKAVGRSMARAGARVSSLRSAAGKVLLALHPHADAMIKFAVADLDPAIVFDPDAFLAELAQIRQSGFATARNPSNRGTIAFAVAIAWGSQPPDLALCISARAEDCSPERVDELVTLLKTGGAQIAAGSALRDR